MDVLRCGNGFGVSVANVRGGAGGDDGLCWPVLPVSGAVSGAVVVVWGHCTMPFGCGGVSLHVPTVRESTSVSSRTAPRGTDKPATCGSIAHPATSIFSMDGSTSCMDPAAPSSAASAGLRHPQRCNEENRRGERTIYEEKRL